MLSDCLDRQLYTVYLTTHHRVRSLSTATARLQYSSWAEAKVDALATVMSRRTDNSYKLKTACPTSTRGMSWTLVGLLALAAGLIRSAAAEDAHCTSGDFAWANNKDGKDPCQVANLLVTKCSNAPFPMLGSGTAMYGGPGDNNECLCNLVEYNLLRVCAKCQSAAEAWVEDFPDWSRNCAKHDQVNFGPGAPDGVSIPDWASGGKVGTPWNMDSLKTAAPAQPVPSPAAAAETPAAQEQASQQQPESSAKVVTEQPPEPTTESTPPVTSEQASEVEPVKATQVQEEGSLATTTSKDETTTPLTTTSPAGTRTQVKAEATTNSSSKTTTTPKAYAAVLREAEPTREADTGGNRPNPTTTEDDQEESLSQRIRLKTGNRQEEQAEATSSALSLPTSRQHTASGIKAPTTSPTTTTDEASSESTKALDVSTTAEDSMLKETQGLSQEDHQPSQLAGPTDLATVPAETSTDTATELLTGQNTHASEDVTTSTDDKVSTMAGGGPANQHVGEDGSMAKSSQSGKEEAEDIDPELEQYHYNGDPGVTAAESGGKGGKAPKVAAICISSLAVLALAVIGFKLFMCFRKRKAEGDERESWMEADIDVQEKSEFAPYKGVSSRQSVWDRIQRSLMPKTLTRPVSVANRAPSNVDGFEDGRATRSDCASSQSPPQTRRSIWSDIRESFGPFGRPSFIAPAPTPNLSALRGVPMRNPFKGILKRPQARADQQMNSQDEEILGDEEAIRPRQNDMRPPLTGIPYYAGAEVQQKQWI